MKKTVNIFLLVSLILGAALLAFSVSGGLGGRNKEANTNGNTFRVVEGAPVNNHGNAPFNSVGPGGGGALYHPAFNPQDANNFFITCDMGSSFVTHDGGKSFQSVLLGRSVSFGGMPRYWFTPHDSNTVFATVGNIVYASYDKGRTWDFMFPSRDDYVGLAHTSTTGGAQPHFKEGTLQANPHVLISFLADPNDANVLYTMSSGRSHGWPTIPAEIYRSADRGKTWQVFKTLDDAPWLDAASNGNKFAIWVDQLQGTTAQMMLFDGELRIATHQGMFRLNAETGETIWNRRIDVGRYTASATSGFGGTTNMVVEDGEMTVYMTMWEGSRPVRYVNSVYKSTDFGVTWESITDNFIEDARTLEGRTIGQHFADTWFDGWAITNVTFSHVVTSGGKIYVSYRGNDWRVQGLAMTEDEGETWQIVLIGANKNQRNGFGGYANQFDVVGPIEDRHGNTAFSGVASHGLAVNPANPGQVITTNMIDAWMTKDGGNTWTSLASQRTDGGRAPVPLAEETAFWRTSGIEPAGQHILAVNPFNKNHMLSGWTDISIFESFDGGKTWTHKTVVDRRSAANGGDGSNGHGGNSHAIAFDPHNEGVILAAYTSRQSASVNDIAAVNAPDAARAGGIARSTDGGETWSRSYLGEPAGTLLSDPNNSGLPRRSIISSIAFDPANKGVVYVLASGAGVYKSTDGGVTFAPINSGVALQTNGAYQGIAGAMRLSDDGKTLLLVNDGVAYRLDIVKQASTWTAVKGPNSTKVVRLEMDSNGALYAATELQELSADRIPFGAGGTRADIGLGGAWVSTDGGETWRQIFNDMYRVTDIASDSRDANILYLTSREGKVYASNQGTKTTLADWVELDGFNFYAPTNIFENPQNPKLIYVTTNCGGTWSLAIPFGSSLPAPEPMPELSPQPSTPPIADDTPNNPLSTVEKNIGQNGGGRNTVEAPGAYDAEGGSVHLEDGGVAVIDDGEGEDAKRDGDDELNSKDEDFGLRLIIVGLAIVVFGGLIGRKLKKSRGNPGVNIKISNNGQ